MAGGAQLSMHCFNFVEYRPGGRQKSESFKFRVLTNVRAPQLNASARHLFTDTSRDPFRRVISSSNKRPDKLLELGLRPYSGIRRDRQTADVATVVPTRRVFLVFIPPRLLSARGQYPLRLLDHILARALVPPELSSLFVAHNRVVSPDHDKSISSECCAQLPPTVRRR